MGYYLETIRIDLSRDMDTLEIIPLADTHIGDSNSSIERILKRVEHIKETPNCYTILNGDIIDFSSRSSISDIESRQFNIMGQLEKAVEIFEPIKDRILCITNGNHENRGYKKEGFDISKMMAAQLGLLDRYTAASAIIFLRFGSPKNNHGNKNKQQLYSIFVNHGSGGGRKEGAKAIRLADMACIVDADVYIHSHTHLPMIMKRGYFRIDTSNSAVANVTKLFINTSSNLDYGGYGEAQEYKPNSTDTPTIFLSGKKREMTAIL